MVLILWKQNIALSGRFTCTGKSGDFKDCCVSEHQAREKCSAAGCNILVNALYRGRVVSSFQKIMVYIYAEKA